ncbi:MAG: hypothetical protein KDD52_06945, partial [Bdellovibrionales bacterium]|nr:hypothetical protein [Bdellovibrionales bacterium]
MTRFKEVFFGFFSVSLCCVIAFYAFQTHARKEKSFSEIIGKTLDGKAFHFEAEVKKHTLTVLNFWETWC